MKGADMKNYLFGFFFLLILPIIFIIDVHTAKSFPPDSSRNEEKLKKLNQANAELNRYYSKKSWDKVYDKLLESRQKGATNYVLQNRSTFIVELKRVYVWPISYKVKTLSAWIDGVDGLTSNIVNMKIKFFPFKTYKDTTYHYWKYHNDDWYLIDFGNDISKKWKNKIGG